MPSLVKHRSGPVTYDVKASRGADPDPYSFYSSTYSVQHGLEGFKPRITRHYGTGYVSNYRPGVYYSTELDDHDNPIVRVLLRDNYLTSHKREIRPCVDSDGKDQFPTKIITKETGFSQIPHAGYVPHHKTYGTRAELVADSERHKPRLHRIQLKRVKQIDEGSMDQVTENQLLFQGETWEKLRIHQKDVGPKEVTGWTDKHHFDPIQYLHPDAFLQGNYCWRPTGPTIHKQQYTWWHDEDGKAVQKKPSLGSSHRSGFAINNGFPFPKYFHQNPNDAFTQMNDIDPMEVEWTQKNDPSEFENLKHAEEKKSLTKCWFRGMQLPYLPKQYDSQGKTQQLSGYSINQIPYMESITTKDNFNTHYQEKICNQPRLGLDRAINRMDTDVASDGFTKSTKIHHLGDNRRFREEEFTKLTPFLSRRIKNQEPYYSTRTMNYKWKNDFQTWTPPEP